LKHGTREKNTNELEKEHKETDEKLERTFVMPLTSFISTGSYTP
jgi:hypothetical protein